MEKKPLARETDQFLRRRQVANIWPLNRPDHWCVLQCRLVYGLSAWNIYWFYRTTCYGGCRNGGNRAGGGGLESADCRPARGSPTSMRGQDASWWPGAHTSAPKAPHTYAAESRSEVSQGLGWMGKQTNGWSLCRPRWGIRRQVDEEKSRKGKGKRESPWPWETRLIKLPLSLRHSSLSSATSPATAIPAVMPVPATLAPSQAGIFISGL